MRYVIIILLILICTMLTCGVLVQFPVLEAQADLLLIALVMMTAFEKRLSPVLFVAAGGLIIDSLFARGLGFYTVPYLVSGILLYAFFAGRNYNNALITAAASGVIWFIKEIISIILCILMGYRIGILNRILTVSLPGIAVEAVLGLISYLPYKWLYSFAFMQPQDDSEFAGLKRRWRRR
ncbi:MAG: rod shape-determining protein MreD [Christensenellaceae bacterium]|nr:rod shape-determining protein MreD [Christensenellaceae bacterium]